MRGRKIKDESRSTEFRRQLIAWKQTPESLRPSLRALARQLGSSHQLLTFFLKHLEEWQGEEWMREASEIGASASGDGRPMTPSEEHRADDLRRAGIRAITDSALRSSLESLNLESKRGLLSWHQFKLLKLLARNGFPEAQELLQKSLQDGVKERKRFSAIVKETPRQEGETYIAWVRRIWDQCDKYDTNCPAMITEALLEKCSRSGAHKQKNNLPAISASAAKSFRSV
jgi:hypothetical protein